MIPILRFFPKGSQPAKFYDLPKLHTKRENHNQPPLRPIASSIGAYNYNLANYLSSLIAPLLPSKYSVNDSFSFGVSILTTSFSFPSMLKVYLPIFRKMKLLILPLILFSSMTLNFRSKNPTLRNCSHSLQPRLIFFLMANFMIKLMGVAMSSPLAPILANLFRLHYTTPTDKM